MSPLFLLLLLSLLVLVTLPQPTVASLFSKPESEFFVFINAHAGEENYQLEAFKKTRTKFVAYGQYDKGALSTSGQTTLTAISNLGTEVKQEVLVEPGAILFIAVHSTQGENPPKIVVASFFDTAFTYAKSNGLAVLVMVNLVRQRNVQIFLDGSLNTKLHVNSTDEEPVFYAKAVRKNHFGSIIEVYDTSAEEDYQLVVRGRMSLEKRKIYACVVMGSPLEQSHFPYTLALVRHSVSMALALAPNMQLWILLLLGNLIWIRS